MFRPLAHLCCPDGHAGSGGGLGGSLASETGPEAGDAPSGLLDKPSLDKLRELDPTGQNRLLERVFKAFDNSAERLLPQLDAARIGRDLAGIRHVTHTLKSSSASLGALRLSRLCAEAEAMARRGEIDALPPRLDALSVELAAVRATLRRQTGDQA